MADYRTVKADSLINVVRSIVKAGGSTDREADLVATNLVEANLKGHDSHGVGVVGLSNSHHIGRIGHWAEQCIAHGLVSIHFVNVLARPIVAPFGGRDARHGTNPFCVGIPRAGKDPIVLDFATSKIAQGKTRVAYNKGEQLAPNTIIDDHGNPVTDPRFTVLEPSAAILPFGEHKGSGLALICELLGGALSGGKTLSDKTWSKSDGSRKVLNGMFSILIDPDKMGTGENLA